MREDNRVVNDGVEEQWSSRRAREGEELDEAIEEGTRPLVDYLRKEGKQERVVVVAGNDHRCQA